MHRQSSKSTLFKLRVRALLFLNNVALAIVTIASLVFWLLQSSELTLKICLVTSCLLIAHLLLFLILSHSWKCPLCMTAIWQKKRCGRNKNAHKAFGISYRLGVAIAVVLGRPYRCPYCGETFSSTKIR